MTKTKNQSAVAPLALMGAAHLSISLLTKLPRYCGVARSSGTIMAPRLSRRSLTLGVCMAASVAACSFLTIAPGGPMGQEERVPGIGLDIRHALLGRGRHIRQRGRALLGQDRDRLDGAAVDLRLGGAHNFPQEIDAAALPGLPRR